MFEDLPLHGVRTRLRALAKSVVLVRPSERDARTPGNPGFCHCCRSQTFFEIRGTWLRDQYICRSCGSIPRQRGLMHVLDSYFPEWPGLVIHESSPTVDYLARSCGQYSSSQLLPGVAPGETHSGVRCEDLEHLTFPAEAFDVFVTQDVLEHVFDPAEVAREIMRVVRFGGAHVFTAPKHPGLRTSRARAQRSGESIEYLLPAEYHGNPVGDGRSLVTWDYGDDFESLVSSWCGYPTTTYVVRDRSLGLDGKYLEVFVTRKLSVDS